MDQMNERNFSELLESVKEVGLIEKGTAAPGREYVIDRHFAPDSANVRTFAICLTDEDDALVPLKIYHVTLQPVHSTCTLKDENNETTVCPMNWFLPIEFPSNIEQLIEKTELALA